ncbi:hypothetical protein [Micromonospora sp. NBC_01796]|uniref:hypothetical protein n=1 Tax=Micromonospora sp. NBC_01796 TaxID=2975987 RepID=UPI002DDA0BD9|nr:hypothetical protein [Micromonospora sp. NBC_01796]WSA88710.1 hypothetical protein OIE47_14510 [Micromonospora sp. NBC_01796]
MADRSGPDPQAKPPLSPAEAAKRAAAAKRAETAKRAAAARRAAPAKRPTGGRGNRDKRIATRLKVGGVVLVVVLAIVGMILLDRADGETGGGGTAVPPPDPTERADTVVLLSNAHQTQQICYGWELHDRSVPVSAGSNLGEDVAVDDDPSRCARWVKVIAGVVYTSESSEASDTASFWVTSSDDLSGIDYVEGLGRFGLTNDDFLADPGWAICRAAVFLPLLVAESGAAPAVPVKTGPDPSASPQATSAALPDAGSDFWRDRMAQVLGAGFLFLISVLLLAIGWFERRHQRRPGTKPKKPSTGPGVGPGTDAGPGPGAGANGPKR